MFDQHYPGFDAVGSVKRPQIPLESWGLTADYQLLATDAERDQWAQQRDDGSRAEFISRFWQRRDPDPGTENNEWRDEFYRRVAFADSIFGDDVVRGALTDRGRVFVLLGRPSRVYVEPIRYRYGRYDGLNGTSERWVFFREQLPVAPPVREVDFVFIDQPGYGDHALVREPMPLQALAAAQTAPQKIGRP